MSTRTLYILRHARADAAAKGGDDHTRKLSERGRRDAEEMGRRLARNDRTPQAIITSSAARAVETARLVARAAHMPDDAVTMTDDLYGAASDDVLQLIAAVDDSIDRLMVVGHNPAFSDAASRLAGRQIDLPTAGMAVFRLESSWASVAEKLHPVERLDSPRDG